MNGRVGPVTVHWPTTIGYYGGVGLALAAGMIEWPIAVFIGAVPVIKMLKDDTTPVPFRFFVDMFQGAAKPVGGDGDSMMELDGTTRSVARSAQRKTPGIPNPRPARKAAPARRRATRAKST